MAASGSAGHKAGAESVVVTRLLGGLGNQLFQYAAGRRLAQVRGVELKLDISALGNPNSGTPRNYELSPFTVQPMIATEEEVAALVRPRRRLLSGLLPGRFRLPGLPPPSHVKEAHFHFDPAILDLPDGVYLDGYWQSERYFADAADVIRADLTITAPAEGRNWELLEQIRSCNAVSVHVRRGDYVSDKHTADYHGTCNLDYYHRAIQYVADAIANPVLFVFSDDPDWVRANLKAPYPITIVDHNGPERCAEDLRLMSACRHHVLANSSFSWWGAWLDPRPEKIIVAPQQWFRCTDLCTVDLVPAGWSRLPCTLIREGT